MLFRSEIPVITTEVKIVEVEKPVIIKETELKVIEKPVIITEIKTIEVEKPVIIKETEIKILEKQSNELSMIVKVCLVAQSLALIGLLLVNILKH